MAAGLAWSPGGLTFQLGGKILSQFDCFLQGPFGLGAPDGAGADKIDNTCLT